MRGRKPKPTAKKKLAGNPGKRKLNAREPTPKVTATLEPAKINELAGEFIKTYLPQLREMNLFTDADKAVLELMSVHYAIAWRAAEIVERQGLAIVCMGKTCKHPLLQVLRDNSSIFKSYAAEFGMTPSSRSRINVPPLPEEDQLEMELFGPAAKVTAK